MTRVANDPIRVRYKSLIQAFSSQFRFLVLEILVSKRPSKPKREQDMREANETKCPFLTGILAIGASTLLEVSKDVAS